MIVVWLDELTRFELTSSNSFVNIRKLPAEYPFRNNLDGVSSCNRASLPRIINLFGHCIDGVERIC